MSNAKTIITSAIIITIASVILIVGAIAHAQQKENFVTCADCGQLVNSDDTRMIDGENTIFYVCDNCIYEMVAG